MFSYLLRLDNSYPENFIDNCFKKFLDNTHLVKEKVPTVERKRFIHHCQHLIIHL